jgi:tRNA A-37 threonylcarbamoyl transferase component Bud32
MDGATVVVKQLVEGPGARERYEREVTGLRLAGRVADPPVAPRLLTTDHAERLLVLEHLAGHRPAADWIVHYAAALARLHAATTARDSGALPAWSGPTTGDVRSFLALAASLDVPVPPGTPGELEALADRLGRLGGHSLLHGDPCPGNDLHTPDGLRFIDFEQASLGSGVTELAYLHIGFPTCWCSTAAPEPLLARAEHAYRTAWHTATGQAVPGDLTDACAGWLIRGDALVQRAHRDTTDHLARLPGKDWTWGTAGARQRLAHRLGVVARMAADRTDLRGLARLSTAMRHRMLERWPKLRPLPPERPPGA